MIEDRSAFPRTLRAPPDQGAFAAGARERGSARLEDSVAAYYLALQERTREHVPLDWAATQNKLGTAL